MQFRFPCQDSIASTFVAQDPTCKEGKPPSRIKIDLRKTEYPVLYNTAVGCLGWKVWSNKKQSKDERDVVWSDGYVSEAQARQLHSYQRINHFPGSQQLGKKNLLAMNLEKLRSVYKETYFPDTWVLPRDSLVLKKCVEDSLSPEYYIAKPQASSQGRGIFLFSKIGQLPKDWESSGLIVQKYIGNPFLIDGLKFDFRIYVLLRSLSPLRVYVFKEGLARFATTKYQPPTQANKNNLMMHLTNYAINKKSPDFVFNRSERDDNIGHKRSYTSVMELIKSTGADVQRLQTQIDEIITKTIISSLPSMSSIYRRSRECKQITSVSFEILGFDVMLDRDLKPYLIEVNHTPSFTTDTPLDLSVKKNLIMDTLSLIRVDEEAKRQFLSRPNGPDKFYSETLFRQLQIQEDNYQSRHCGDYRRIFPSNSNNINRLHDQLMGVKTNKAHRIDYQNINKNRISEMNKRNKHSFSAFPEIMQLSELAYERSGLYSRQGSDEQKSYRQELNNNLPADNLVRSLHKEGDKYVGKHSLSKPRVGPGKNIWVVSPEEKKDCVQPLKLKNLEIDFTVPLIKEMKNRNNTIHSALKAFRQGTVCDQLQAHSSIRCTPSATKNILFNLQKNKKDIDAILQPLNLKSIDQTIASQPKSSTIYYELSRFHRPSRLRQRSHLKSHTTKVYGNYSRKFSCQERRLIMGYD